MGFLDRFFRKPRQTATVAIDDLPEWFAAQAKPKVVQFQAAVAEQIRVVHQLRRQLEVQLSKLEHAPLQNEHIPQKAKVMMEGSRALFLRAARQFLSSTEPPSHAAAEELEPFLETSGEALLQFTKSTTRATMVLSEFFAHELKALHASFAALEEATQRCYPDQYRQLIELQQRIASLAADAEERERITFSLGELAKQRAESEAQVQRMAAEAAAVKQGKDYRHLQELEQDEAKLLRRRKQVEYAVGELFSPLTPVLKKLTHDGVQVKVFEPYLAGPLAALQQDSALAILDALQSAAQQLEQGMELKEDKAERAKKNLAAITKEVLQQHLAQVHAIDAELRKLKSQIAGNTIRNRIAEAEYRVAHLQRRLQQSNDEAEKIQKAIAAREAGQSTEQLSAELSEVLGMDVVLESR